MPGSRDDIYTPPAPKKKVRYIVAKGGVHVGRVSYGKAGGDAGSGPVPGDEYEWRGSMGQGGSWQLKPKKTSWGWFSGGAGEGFFRPRRIDEEPFVRAAWRNKNRVRYKKAA